MRDPVQDPALPVGRAPGLGPARDAHAAASGHEDSLGAGAPRGRVVPRAGRHARRPDRAARAAWCSTSTPDLTAHDGRRADAAGGWTATTPRDPELGGNVRWGVTSNLTLNGTVNPDFSQVEADAEPVHVRPAQRGVLPGEAAVLPRRARAVPDARTASSTRGASSSPIGGGEADGQDRRHTARRSSPRSTTRVARRARGDDHPLFNLLRVQRDLGGQSKAALVVHRQGGRARLEPRGGRRRAPRVRGEIYNLQLQAGVSAAPSAAVTTLTAPLWQARLERNGRRFGLAWRATAWTRTSARRAASSARPRS